jgi:hypothetical protein
VDAQAVIRSQLSPSEQMLWAGRPRQGIVFHTSDLFFIPFMVLWLALCVFGVFNVIAESPDPAGAAVGVIMLTIFFLFGVGFGFGRFFIDRWIRARTVYGISSERILIVIQAFRRTVKSLCLDTLTDVTLTQSANGSGIITFGPVPPWYWSTQAGWSNWGWGALPMFELADNPREVYETVRNARRIANTGRSG